MNEKTTQSNGELPSRIESDCAPLRESRVREERSLEIYRVIAFEDRSVWWRFWCQVCMRKIMGLGSYKLLFSSHIQILWKADHFYWNNLTSKVLQSLHMKSYLRWISALNYPKELSWKPAYLSTWCALTHDALSLTRDAKLPWRWEQIEIHFRSHLALIKAFLRAKKPVSAKWWTLA